MGKLKQTNQPTKQNQPIFLQYVIQTGNCLKNLGTISWTILILGVEMHLNVSVVYYVILKGSSRRAIKPQTLL